MTRLRALVPPNACACAAYFHHSKEEIVSKYIGLMNWTDKGVQDAANTVKRADDARKLGSSMGVTFDMLYWTTGQYDLVAVVDAPDDETLSAFLLKVAGSGNLRSESMRAFTDDEMKSITAKLG